MPDNGQVDQIDGWNGDLIPVRVLINPSNHQQHRGETGEASFCLRGVSYMVERRPLKPHCLGGNQVSYLSVP